MLTKIEKWRKHFSLFENPLITHWEVKADLGHNFFEILLERGYASAAAGTGAFYIPPVIPGDAPVLRSGGSQNRLLCGHLKVLVFHGNNHFEPPADHGRYNILDFTGKVVCQPGVPHPIGCPGPKGASAPLWKPAGFEICIYKLEKGGENLQVSKQQSHSQPP